jgi:hypothetical protein
MVFGPTPRPPLERFFEHIEIDPVTDCWLWTGSITPNGYGQFFDGEKLVTAHRWLYGQMVEAVLDDADADHLCHNRDLTCAGGSTCRHRRCSNPEHIEPTTHLENVRRGRGGAYWRAKTHCPQGHEYTEANTYIYKGRRVCRQCNRDAQHRMALNGYFRGNGKRSYKNRGY